VVSKQKLKSRKLKIPHHPNSPNNIYIFPNLGYSGRERASSTCHGEAMIYGTS
jgi:hypothetical protein